MNQHIQVSNSLEVCSVCQKLAEKTRSLWRQHRPVTASLWGEPILHRAEDLSTRGHEGWISALETLALETNNICSQVTTLADIVLCNEIARFIDYQLYQATTQRPYHKRLISYLSLISTALLPFTLKTEYLSTMKEALTERLTTINTWLDYAEIHYTSGELTVSSAEVSQAIVLATAIADFISRQECQTHHLQEEGNKICLQLRRWEEERPQRTTPSQKVQNNQQQENQIDQFNHLLTQCYGTLKPLDWWQSTLVERLWIEVETLNQAEAQGDTLQAAATASDWNYEVWGHPQETNKALPDEPKDPYHILGWITQAYNSLQTSLTEHNIINTSPPTSIAVAPPITQILVPEALFLRVTHGNSPGQLLVSPLLLQRQQPLLRREFLRLAIIAAHELCPGHYQHVDQQSKSIFAPYFDFLQNPIGFEGWAVYGERFITHIDPSAQAISSYHLIRRLLPNALIFTNIYRGREEANKLLQQVIRQCPSLAPSAGRPGFLSESSLVYAIGLIETETSIEELRAHLGSEVDRAETYRRYLSQGPIAPSAVVKLAKLHQK
ncbi:MAG: hypothetical protein GFH27_549297n248 [Chloroflexi bacterium AL-W]|nr:hypothetical protein [Chloroflexi bacterium AL-N1]NOK68899.1 hypothetical protein [Chloroflexi bacterium AL-N10]NOK76882.1 hypothetical protein [Chloroflexi bacterium AL-N5]NOK82730.1 hypothetical protein [Chloroflexi bacterium AL-W]NOK90739.1 hypothetical protein [Chloroflexi bacterium AL-N15]